jgi:hypothetical protein
MGYPPLSQEEWPGDLACDMMQVKSSFGREYTASEVDGGKISPQGGSEPGIRLAEGSHIA